MAKTAKVTFIIIIFLPTLLHDLAASRQVKINISYWSLEYAKKEILEHPEFTVYLNKMSFAIGGA